MCIIGPLFFIADILLLIMLKNIEQFTMIVKVSYIFYITLILVSVPHMKCIMFFFIIPIMPYLGYKLIVNNYYLIAGNILMLLYKKICHQRPQITKIQQNKIKNFISNFVNHLLIFTQHDILQKLI